MDALRKLAFRLVVFALFFVLSAVISFGSGFQNQGAHAKAPEQPAMQDATQYPPPGESTPFPPGYPGPGQPTNTIPAPAEPTPTFTVTATATATQPGDAPISTPTPTPTQVVQQPTVEQIETSLPETASPVTQAAPTAASTSTVGPTDTGTGARTPTAPADGTVTATSSAPDNSEDSQGSGMDWGLFWIGFSIPVLFACGAVLYLLDRNPRLFSRK